MSSFKTEEISIAIDGITIVGTLTLPKNKSNPCVILLSGYGPKTRDAPIGDFNRYEFLAEELAKKGIASYRYDDRGCGKSSDVNWHSYTFDDLANEVIKIHSVLKNHHQTSSSGYPSIHTKKIGLYGHSLGATIAPLAATKSPDFSFVISSAPHGLIGTETAIHTRNAFAQAGGETLEERPKREKQVREVLKGLQKESTCKEALEKLQQIMLERYNQTAKEISFESYLQAKLEGYLLSLGCSPMYRYFLNFNPQKMYQQLKCSILLLFAGNDLYHPTEFHQEAIVSSLNKSEVTAHNFEKVNHDFIQEENQTVIGYVDNFTETIINWSKSQFNM